MRGVVRASVDAGPAVAPERGRHLGLGAPRRRARGPAAAALLIVTSVALGGCALSLQSLPKVSGVGTATYPLHAVFGNVLNLPDDAQVRVGAQVVGQVGLIATRNFQADLTLDPIVTEEEVGRRREHAVHRCRGQLP